MPTVKNNFVSGKMSNDVDARLLQKGAYRTASNIQIANSNGSNVGAIEKTLSNQKITDLSLGENAFTVGGTSDEFEEKLYWLVKSDSGSYLIEYNKKTNITSFVLKDTRIESVLALDKDYLVTGIVLVIDTDNGNRFLLFTDNNTDPKCVNIERAKTYGENGFEKDEILLIKKPPLDAPEITLSKTESQDENYIEEKFLRFYTRFKYLDNEYSAFSPGSQVAFKPKSFNFDFATSTNESMVNEFNKVDIQFNTGSKLVKEIEVLFIESGKNIPYVIENFNKEDKGWDDDTNESIPFINNKIYKTLSDQQLFRLFDGVPLKAKTLEVINNILVIANYTENENLIDKNNAKVNVDINLEVDSLEVTEGNSYLSNKTNADYEVGLVYGETYGRHSTVLTSENNTVHIPVAASDKKNVLKLTITNKPPKFANWFRVFVKQNKYNYDTIVPTLFYEDGIYRWIKLEGSDNDKIKEGDYLLVKSDSQGKLDKTVFTKVLEVKSQEKNFLQSDDVVDIIAEQAGRFFKIKPDEFRLHADDYENFEINTYHNSKRQYHGALRLSSEIIGKAYFYGEGINDLTVSGTCTLPDMIDKRFTIEIVSTDSFEWSIDEGANTNGPIVITPNTAQNLSDGVEITFGSSSGYTVSDTWNIYARGKLISSDSKAYGFFRTQGKYNETQADAGHDLQDEIIEAVARINLEYDEYNTGKFYFNKSFISSSQYANIQEWYYKENIGDEIISVEPDFDLSRIYFMRGILKKHNINDAGTFLEYNEDGYMTMVLESQNSQDGIEQFGIDFLASNTKIVTKTTLFQSDGDSKVVLETKSKEVDSDVFFEIGRTYPIVDGFHTSLINGDQNQTATLEAIVTLPTFNCFGWGNGFESIKIKDLFNEKSFSIQTRPNAPIENYRQNKKIASFTYSQPYSQSLNYNGLNEFNLSQNNSKDLDDALGSIQFIKAFDTDLDVWQEDKTSKVLFGKTMLYNADGSANITKSNLLFDTVVPASGEFGTVNPESVAAFGNYRYWVDRKRGVVLRKGQSGIEIISNFGMKSWFRENLKNTNPIMGSIDPFTKQYVLTIDTERKPKVISVEFPNGTCCQ